MTDTTKITVVINGSSYHLSASDSEAAAKIAPEDRKSLLALLHTLKQQQQASEHAAASALNQANRAAHAPTPTIKPERLGSGDVDALMAKLAVEEKSRQKAPSKQSVYKWIGIITAAIILGILIF